ncbi:PLP-dependent aminotransferase family protein [Nocardia huaxiensis]|uniref:aminotransferase-like domain-containing protein n=1 Tax=Nocardia huaxiensis TaxID=2755382 RepID=UPI001E4F7ED4|nr:aminotransferase class I/II-fold pyridoxal phosphate-dependent enzyme [Nocardia huaxiensis]UFS98747.1 aminotransferase class I/II-fold pyridoxal phosphate-dependent enzyme [Nocardia huaxiensis]
MTTELGPPDGETATTAPDGITNGDTPAAALFAAVDERTAAGIAAAVSRGIRSGTLASGTRLPTVRAIARELKVSPATVNQAWRALANTGAIVARGRAGTFVGQPPPSGPGRPASRYQRLHPQSDSAFRIDLSRGTPDPALLPDLTSALRVLAADEAIDDLSATYLGDAALPALLEIVRADWPMRAERFTVLDGALDAVDRLLAAHVRLGDRVLVENPCFPPFLDLLARAGARPVPVAMDESGLLPADLAEALQRHTPTALLYQSRAQNPTGASLSARRVRELWSVLAHDRLLIIEDDHSDGIAHAPLRSLGAKAPTRTVHIRSYSKSHGADLRLAIVGGPADYLDPVIERRMLGPGWSSHLLQRVLAHMLTAPEARHTVSTARTEYRTRTEILRNSLSCHNIHLPHTDGINIWLPVADETSAMISLAAAGIKVAPGAPFEVTDHPHTDHIRLTVAALHRTDIPDIAAHLAAATTALPTYRRIRRT